MASRGGIADHGTVFRLDPATFAVTTIHRFDGHDGSSPQGALLSADGKLHGTAFGRGWGDRGTGFEPNPDGSGFAAQRTFAGGWIQSGLTLDAQGRAWGAASVDKPLPGDAGKGFGGIFTIEADGHVTVAHRFARDPAVTTGHGPPAGSGAVGGGCT